MLYGLWDWGGWLLKEQQPLQEEVLPQRQLSAVKWIWRLCLLRGRAPWVGGCIINKHFSIGGKAGRQESPKTFRHALRRHNQQYLWNHFQLDLFLTVHKWFEQLPSRRWLLRHNWSSIMPKFDMDLISSPRTRHPRAVPLAFGDSTQFVDLANAATTTTAGLKCLQIPTGLPAHPHGQPGGHWPGTPAPCKNGL